jgi:hypothetical protein
MTPQLHVRTGQDSSGDTHVEVFVPEGFSEGTYVAGWILKDAKLAARLARACEAGVVLTGITVFKTSTGKTIPIAARNNVIGRTANADLKRLGF